MSSVTASHLPVRMARRLDRLAARAHRFHRFSHHPLCAAYDGETLRVGRRARVCRGCAAAALGAVLGVGVGLAFPVPPGAVMGVALLLLAAVVALATLRRGGPLTPTLTPTLDRDPDRDRPPARASKLLTRTLPAAAAAGLVILGARAASVAGLATAGGALALGAMGTLAYRRRGPDRSPCTACPERGGPKVCSGFAPMARREKAFSRLARRLLRALPPPAR